MTLRKIKGFLYRNPFNIILQVRLEQYPPDPLFTTFDLRVHFLHRGYLLGGIGIERHRRCKPPFSVVS